MMETDIRIKKEAICISAVAIGAQGAAMINNIPIGRTTNPIIGMINRLERSVIVETLLK